MPLPSLLRARRPREVRWSTTSLALLLSLLPLLARGDSPRIAYGADIREAINKITEQLARAGKVPKGTPIRPIPFQGRGFSDSGIAVRFSEALNAKGYPTDDPAARFQLGGSIRLAGTKDSPLGVKVVAKLEDMTTGKLDSFEGETNNREELYRVTEGVLGPEPGQGTDVPPTRLTVENELLRPAPGYPYAVGVMVKDPQSGEFHPAAIRVEGEGANARAVVDLKLGDVYRLRIVNESTFAAAALVTIDGVDLFAFAENPNLRNNRFVLQSPAQAPPAQCQTDLIGFYIAESNWHSMTVGVAEESVLRDVGLPGDSNKVGVITVAFSAAWASGEAEPPNEKVMARQSGLGTKRGPIVKGAGVQQIPMQSGRLRAVLKLNYGA